MDAAPLQLHSSKKTCWVVHVLMHAWCLLLQSFERFLILKPDPAIAELELLSLLSHQLGYESGAVGNQHNANVQSSLP